MMAEQRKSPLAQNIIWEGLPPVKTEISNGIQVTVRIPENIPESTRQRKVNRIYDILNPGVPR